MALFGEVLDEHLLEFASVVVYGMEVEGVTNGGHGDDKRRIVGALYNVVVQLNDLFDAGN